MSWASSRFVGGCALRPRCSPCAALVLAGSVAFRSPWRFRASRCSRGSAASLLWYRVSSVCFSWLAAAPASCVWLCACSATRSLMFSGGLSGVAVVLWVSLCLVPWSFRQACLFGAICFVQSSAVRVAWVLGVDLCVAPPYSCFVRVRPCCLGLLVRRYRARCCRESVSLVCLSWFLCWALWSVCARWLLGTWSGSRGAAIFRASGLGSVSSQASGLWLGWVGCGLRLVFDALAGGWLSSGGAVPAVVVGRGAWACRWEGMGCVRAVGGSSFGWRLSMC